MCGRHGHKHCALLMGIRISSRMCMLRRRKNKATSMLIRTSMNASTSISTNIEDKGISGEHEHEKSKHGPHEHKHPGHEKEVHKHKEKN